MTIFLRLVDVTLPPRSGQRGRERTKKERPGTATKEVDISTVENLNKNQRRGQGVASSFYFAPTTPARLSLPVVLPTLRAREVMQVPRWKLVKSGGQLESQPRHPAPPSTSQHLRSKWPVPLLTLPAWNSTIQPARLPPFPCPFRVTSTTVFCQFRQTSSVDRARFFRWIITKN